MTGFATGQTGTGLPHSVFLRRLAGTAEPPGLEPRLGRAAFLVLRLVDLLGPGHDGLHPDAFRYQRIATERCCRDLPPTSTEANHLLGLVEGTDHAFRQSDVALVLPALFAYGHFLEDELRLEEALDVLDEALHVGGETMPTEDGIVLRLRRARVLRMLNSFDAAEQAYAEGGALAGATGDTHSELLSRIGRAETLRGRGNLPAAETGLRAALAEAEAGQDRYAQALAHQGIAVVLSTSGRPHEAIPHLWRAFQLYDDEQPRIRALGDMGALLLLVGDVAGAEHALRAVVHKGGSGEVVDNAMIELMHCASYRRDRVGFERWRERCEARRDDMPPNILVDFTLKAGIGWARFGQFARGERVLTSALEIADDGGLHEFAFRIDRIRAGLRDCQEAAAEPVVETEAVREVSDALARLEV